MNHSRMSGRKIVGVIVRFEKVLGCGELTVKKARDISIVTHTSVVMVLLKTQCFCCDAHKTPVLYR
jgi:hypothetical protein